VKAFFQSTKKGKTKLSIMATKSGRYLHHRKGMLPLSPRGKKKKRGTSSPMGGRKEKSAHPGIKHTSNLGRG